MQQQQQQQQIMQMQPMMAAYASSPTANVTTDLIQQYLDENKQLILAILENQNSGKVNECAENQAKLQRNLMYLAAIADSQPQVPSAAQFPPNAVMQSAPRYMQSPQAHQLTPQSLMAARSSMMYAQSPLSAMQHQQAMQAQMGMTSGGNNGPHMSHGEVTMGSGGGIFPDFGRNTGMGKQDAGSTEGRGGNSGGQTEGTETPYLKGSEEGS